MVILGLFWLSWVVFLFTIKRNPKLQYYLGYSYVQANKSLTFSLVFTSIGLTYYLESVTLILTVLGSIFSLWVLQTGGCKWHKRKRNITQ